MKDLRLENVAAVAVAMSVLAEEAVEQHKKQRSACKTVVELRAHMLELIRLSKESKQAREDAEDAVEALAAY